MQQNQPCCAYCGCNSIDCLAIDKATGMYFCNGKGSTQDSHLIHHLNSIHCSNISLPPENSYSQVPLTCYVCSSSNIFNLGFINSPSSQKWFLICEQCRYDSKITSQNIDQSTYLPLVSNGYLTTLLRIPEEHEYRKISIYETIPITQLSQERIGMNTHSNSLPPSINPAHLMYSNIQSYFQTFTSFVNLEEESTRSLDESSKYPCQNINWTSETSLTFHTTPQLFKRSSIGMSLSFSPLNSHAHDRDNSSGDIGTVTQRTFSMEFSISFKSKPQCYGNNQLICKQVFSSIPYERHRIALHKFADPNCDVHWLIKDAFLGIIEKFPKHNRVKTRQIHLSKTSSLPTLNESQERAASVALNQRVTLIQGPPGSGKTTLIAHLAHSFVDAGIRPILVCAQSNVAADFATTACGLTGHDVVRVMSSTREYISPQLQQYSSFHKAVSRFNLSPEEISNMNGNIKIPEKKNNDPFVYIPGNENKENDEIKIDQNYSQRNKRMSSLEHAVIETSDIVVATCISAGGARLKDIHFPVVIVDEAGQCLDPDLLICVTHGTQQLILVGDHRQLGPLVASKKAKSARYDIPLLQRLVLLGVKPSVLRIQYRMHPLISEFPSKTFYHSLLQNGINELDCRSTIFTSGAIPGPLLFWNVPGAHEEPFEGSFINRNEAVIVGSLLKKLMDGGVKVNDIGIITPYAGQQTYLIENLFQLTGINDPDYFENLEIASVDAFQGREKNFIIFSCVRANPDNDIGFLKDPRRLCVSLTRARLGLFVIANANTFAKNKLWIRFIQHCIEKKVFLHGTFGNFNISEFIPLIVAGNDAEIEAELENPDVGDEGM